MQFRIPTLLLILSLSDIYSAPMKLEVANCTPYCCTYNLLDEKGQAVIISQEITESLQCGNGASLSPNQAYLAYAVGYDLKVYDFVQKKSRRLFKLPSSKGESNVIWNSQSTKLAIVSIKLDKKSELFVFSVDTRIDNDFDVYELNIDYGCGKTCEVSESDFYFGSENVIKYKVRTQISNDSVFEIEPSERGTLRKYLGQGEGMLIQALKLRKNVKREN